MMTLHEAVRALQQEHGAYGVLSALAASLEFDAANSDVRGAREERLVAGAKAVRACRAKLHRIAQS